MYSFFYVLYKVITGDHRPREVRDARRLAEGLTLLRQRRHDEALVYFDDFLTHDPHCALALAKRGACHLALREPYLALGDCRRATEEDQHLSDAYLVAGQALYGLKEYREAFLEFDKAVWYGRRDPAAYRWRGLAHLKLENPAQAARDFRHAITLGDEDANHYLRQHRLHVKRYDAE